MMIPAMKREGYKPAFAVAVTACAAMMAPIIPPSIIAVIYGSVTGVSIGALFLGGVVPGVLAGLSMMLLTWFLAPRAGARPSPRATWRRGGSGHRCRAMPAMVMPVIIIGGILSGAFTPDRSRRHRGALCAAVRSASAAGTASLRSTATSPPPRRRRPAR